MSEISEEQAVAAEVSATEEAPKRRPGRPRKTTEPTQASASASEAEEAPKRRPGRPKKVVTDTEASADDEAPKKRTTRKKAAAEEVPGSAEAATEEAPKRRPGRPKKVAESAQTGEEAPATEEKPKRRPGRPKKSEAKPADEKVFSDVASPEEIARILAEAKKEQESAATEDAPAPKRRGRKPKAALADVEASVEAPVEVDEEAPKKHTRKRVTDVEDAAREATADSASEAAAEAVEGKSEAPAEGADSRETEGQNRRNKRKRRDEGGSQDKAEGNETHGGNNDNHGKNQQDNARSRRREKYEQRKKNKRDRNKPVQPKTSREDLAALKVAELRAKADELGVEHKGLLKAALVDAVYEAAIKAEGFVEVEGILDIMPDGFGFVRTNGYLSGPGDAYVHASMVRKNGLRKGDKVKGQTRPARQGDKFPALQSIATVNGKPLEELGKRPRFADLTPVFPDERLVMEHGKNTITARVIDLCAPIGKGQRGLIVSPPKAGKTTVLKNIAAAISANNPEVHLICLLVDERPEEVTDMQRSINGEVVASTFDMPCENHITCAEMVIERAKRLVEDGEDVVILLDSLTRLARAYNLAQPASGRILSGGVDSTALYPPKKFLGAARNIEGGGSLTILASALVETGSKMDEVIFEEFKGTGNMELKLDRQLAERRIFPAIDPVASGTRREDLLLDPQEAPLIWAVRRILSNRNNTERAMDTLIKSLYATRNNQEFLVRTAKKAQSRSLEENAEF